MITELQQILVTGFKRFIPTSKFLVSWFVFFLNVLHKYSQKCIHEKKNTWIHLRIISGNLPSQPVPVTLGLNPAPHLA